MSLIATDKRRIIIGLGQTGLSCARYFQRHGQPFAVCDTREAPAGVDDFRAAFPGVELRLGKLDTDWLLSADELVISPGVDKRQPEIQQAVAAGVPLIGDIDLFCREATAPIVAITGSNAKSTVTTLVGEMAQAAGINVGVGGNIGLPALDLLEQPADLYVLELSSFQLETAHGLKAAAATVLNISPDHLDRYDSMQDYVLTKQRIYRGAAKVIANRDDPLTQPLMAQGVELRRFGLGEPDLKDYGLREHEGETWLCQGLTPLLPVTALKLRGSHNHANALAALALAEAVNIPREAALQALQAFAGLEHRCQWVADIEGVGYYNDSKGTNVGATLAALEGLGTSLAPGAGLILLAGGVGKDQAFGELSAPLQRYGKALVLFGRDARQIASEVKGVETSFADSLEVAVQQAAQLAVPGDLVLLSPACASFDMFSGYPARGEAFVNAVEALR
ncbi:UDP-N-acetylmuramoyl-L-alanine--D-glutamate ligase [Marinobacterium sp. AK62]|uniref:UDP-N-acetylmuramoylalanine--D-glutamate ligase n=1 Tax=Marinobacterium alkalitolerans TaxID=1542925 RepID=A0ABS3Z747_9GAMM|nr:UDP-N-acetylmuramoyl-L-alanine--D-glutamate ligase [Marinobacterium alkalitolerans]MBP0047529.1 UDP-N-acetylmuramoyl-L-alanine--D-glutamate ligase [Marinobacterium alkalitolerans]